MVLIIAGKYRIAGYKIGSGEMIQNRNCDSFHMTTNISDTFSGTYIGTNITNGEQIAIKIEAIKTKHPKLNNEIDFYNKNKGAERIPTVEWFGREGKTYCDNFIAFV